MNFFRRQMTGFYAPDALELSDRFLRGRASLVARLPLKIPRPIPEDMLMRCMKWWLTRMYHKEPKFIFNIMVSFFFKQKKNPKVVDSNWWKRHHSVKHSMREENKKNSVIFNIKSAKLETNRAGSSAGIYTLYEIITPHNWSRKCPIL